MKRATDGHELEAPELRPELIRGSPYDANVADARSGHVFIRDRQHLRRRIERRHGPHERREIDREKARPRAEIEHAVRATDAHCSRHTPAQQLWVGRTPSRIELGSDLEPFGKVASLLCHGISEPPTRGRVS